MLTQILPPNHNRLFICDSIFFFNQKFFFLFMGIRYDYIGKRWPLYWDFSKSFAPDSFFSSTSWKKKMASQGITAVPLERSNFTFAITLFFVLKGFSFFPEHKKSLKNLKPPRIFSGVCTLQSWLLPIHPIFIWRVQTRNFWRF